MNSNNIYIRYINLDKRLDKNDNTIKKFVNILGFDSKNIKRFSAIDGSNIIDELKNKNYLHNKFIKILQSLNLNFKSCELGCLLSHYFLLEEIISDLSIPDDSYIFIFEDDFFIGDNYFKSNNLTEIVNKLINTYIDNNNLWDIIFFGGRFKQNFCPSNHNIKKFFSHSVDNYYLRIHGHGQDWDRTTHNYLVKKKNIGKIINCILDYYSSKLNNKPITQIDTLYNSLSKKINIYDYFPHIFYSPLNYSTDIQNSKLIFNTKNFYKNEKP